MLIISRTFVQAALAMAILICWPAIALADCRSFSFSVWQPAAERVVLRPQTLLSDFPSGGPRMANRVAIIGASSRAGLVSVLKAAPLASAQQRSAIAEGLATAARLCERVSPAEARRIEMAVERSVDTELRREFRTAFQSELGREAQTRSEQLVEEMKRQTGRNDAPTNTGLFNSRNTSGVPAVVAPVVPAVPVVPR